mmetsp:Transcript_12591/g.39657  ORF Transcript_12591/g.39657 Transcript_12591/m.39657 type:complete len:258 (-) Transcript_12591:98-871(-)
MAMVVHTSRLRKGDDITWWCSGASESSTVTSVSRRARPTASVAAAACGDDCFGDAESPARRRSASVRVRVEKGLAGITTNASTHAPTTSAQYPSTRSWRVAPVVRLMSSRMRNTAYERLNEPMIMEEAVERRSKRLEVCTHAFCTPGPNAEIRTMPTWSTLHVLESCTPISAQPSSTSSEQTVAEKRGPSASRSSPVSRFDARHADDEMVQIQWYSDSCAAHGAGTSTHSSAYWPSAWSIRRSDGQPYMMPPATTHM